MASSPSTTPSPHAFGLRLEGDLALPSTEGAPGTTTPAGRVLELRRATRAGVLGAWPDGARDLERRPGTSGRTAWLVQAHDRAGILLRMTTLGAYRLEPAGTVAHCALPSRGPAWHWQRMVVAQVLPFAALLHGLEVLHAGAVALGGGAVAVAAPSQGGKSTLLAALVARGAPLVADDVVAAERDAAGAVLVHPGPGLLSLREGGLAALGADAERLGPADPRLGPWRAVARAPAPLPLRAFCVLRRDHGAGAIEVRRGGVRGPELLGATFNAAWQERDRLVRQLDLTAAIASSSTVLRLTAPPSATPAELAAALEEALEA